MRPTHLCPRPTWFERWLWALVLGLVASPVLVVGTLGLLNLMGRH